MPRLVLLVLLTIASPLAQPSASAAPDVAASDADRICITVGERLICLW